MIINSEYTFTKAFPKSVDPDPLSTEYFMNDSSDASSSKDLFSNFEVSLHKPGIAFKRELSTVFPDLENFRKSDLFVIPTFQYCKYDIIRTTRESDWERNMLCAYFIQFGKDFVSACYKNGCLWADFTDPMDGLPVCSQRGNSIYPDVDGIIRLLKYPTIQVGACAVIDHPRWKTHNYPGTLFAVGSLQNVQQALSDIGAYNYNIQN